MRACTGMPHHKPHTKNSGATTSHDTADWLSMALRSNCCCRCLRTTDSSLVETEKTVGHKKRHLAHVTRSVGATCRVLVPHAECWCHMQSVGATCRVLVPHAECWCHMQSVGATCRVLVPHAECWCHMQSVRATCRVLVPHAECWCTHAECWCHMQSVGATVKKKLCWHRNRGNGLILLSVT